MCHEVTLTVRLKKEFVEDSNTRKMHDFGTKIKQLMGKNLLE